MATDLIARSLATAARDGALPGLPRFADLPTRTIPAAATGLDAGAGATRASYAADALAAPALAAAHPRFCKADASGRYFRLVGLEVDIAQGGASASANGAENRAAIQATISYAAAVGILCVVNRTLPTLELWDKVGTGVIGEGAVTFFAEKLLTVPSYATHLDIDFGGATITLKGPSGGARYPLPTVPDVGQGSKFGGGFLTVTPASMEYLRVANVTVSGGFTGDPFNQGLVSLYDKGFSAPDRIIKKLVTENIELSGFCGEVIYDNSSVIHHTTNCHFHTSPQSAWNPNGKGRVFAVNLRAGNSYQPAEVVGGAGHTYIGGEFYDSGPGGCTFVGGPDPAFGDPYQTIVRPTDRPPPMIHFAGTVFRTGGAVHFGAFVSGRVKTFDTTISFDTFANTPAPQDVNLEIEAWIDRVTNIVAVAVYGGATAGASDNPSNIDVRVTAKRTKLAQTNGRRFQPVVFIAAGYFDADSVRFTVDGDPGAMSAVWSVSGTPGAGFKLPYIKDNIPGFGGLASVFPAVGANSVAVNGAGVFLFPGGPGTYNIALSLNGWEFADGQPFRVRQFNNNDTSRICAVAKNATGVMLNADRTLRRYGEFLDLRWDSAVKKFVEDRWLDQGP